VKLTVVGCSGSVPGPDSSASCYLVEADGFRLVVDLGHGAFGALQRYIRPDEIDAVALSHLHADHCIDLTALHVAYSFGGYHIRGRLPVYGPAGTSGRMADAAGNGEAGIASSCSFHDLATTSSIGPFHVSTAVMAHPVPTNAMRLDVAGQSFVYSGDTGPSDSLRQLAVGADLLLAEAAFVDGANNPPDLHLTGKQAGEVANDAGVGRLVLTHIPPWNDPKRTLAEARSTFSGDVCLAAPGMSIALGS